MSSIIIISSFIIDLILCLLLPYMRNSLSLFTPLIVPVTIYLIYPFYKKKEKKYIVTTIILGLIYDLRFTNLLFFNAILFLSISLITIYINKNFRVNLLSNTLFTILVIIIYEVTEGLLFYIYGVTTINIREVIYYITHSLITNVIYTTIIYFFIKSDKNYKLI